MLGGPTVKQLWELAGQQHSIRAIARELSLSRNTVRKYLRALLGLATLDGPTPYNRRYGSESTG